MRIGNSKVRSLRLEFDWKNNKFGTIIDILRVGCILAILISFMLCFLTGCQEQLTDKPSPRELLIKSPADWVEKYGNDLESQQTANIVLAIQVINRQGEAIKQLNDRLVVLEDPNEIEWPDLFFTDFTGREIGIGYRSDGVVVWRNKD